MTLHTPTYVSWSPEEARRMAQGQLASIEPSAMMAVPGDTLTSEQLNSLLMETDAYIAQGLYERAFGHLRRIFSVDPESLDAHERAYSIYVAQGNTRESSAQLLNILRLCTRRVEVQRAQPYLAAPLQREPHHPEVPAFLAVLRPGGRA
jgi:hypothetical protein